MYRVFFLTLGAFWTFSYLLLDCSGQSPSELPKNDFLTAASTAWKNFEGMFYTQINGRITEVLPPEIAKYSGQTIFVKAKGRRFRFIHEFEANPHPKSTSVAVVNLQYGFQLSQTGTAQFVIDTIVDGKLPNAREKLRLHDQNPLYVSICPTVIGMESLVDIFTEDRLETIHASQNENGTVDVKFRIDSDANSNPILNIHSGSITFEPRRYWLPIKGDVIATAKGRTLRNTWEFAFNTEDSSVLPTRRITMSWIDDIASPQIETVYEWRLDGMSLPDADFTLSSFGFPEPQEFVATSWTRTLLLWSSVAAICVFALSFRNSIKRNRKSV